MDEVDVALEGASGFVRPLAGRILGADERSRIACCEHPWLYGPVWLSRLVLLRGRMAEQQMLFERSERLERLLAPAAVRLGAFEWMAVSGMALEVGPAREGALLDGDAGVIETVLMGTGVSEGVVGAFVFAQSGGVGKGEAAVGMRAHVRLGARGAMGLDEMGAQGVVLEELLRTLVALQLGLPLLAFVHVLAVDLELLLGPESARTTFLCGRRGGR